MFGMEQCMSRWRLQYVLDAVGDTPVQRTVEVEIDTAGLDVFGADEQQVLGKLRDALAAVPGAGGQLTAAEQIS